MENVYLIFRRSDDSFVRSINGISCNLTVISVIESVNRRFFTIQPSGEEINLFDFYVTLNGNRLSEEFTGE